MSASKGEEAPEVFREAILYREWGYRLASLGRYPVAIDYFEKACESAEDLRTLIGLCRTLIKHTRYLAAEKLSEKCMKIDPGHYKARQIRMEALFQIGEFGPSLAHAYEGMRRHGMTFEHGIYQANETVEDCIGRNTSPMALLLLYPWIRRLYEHRERLIGKLEVEEDEFKGVYRALTMRTNLADIVAIHSQATIRLVDRIKNKFDSYLNKMFPLKQKCLDALYKMVAWVYIDTRNLTCLDNEELKTRYLKHHLGIRVATLPRDSDLAWMPTVNPKETLKMFRRRLAMASAPLELAWLHHEFCKFLIDIHRFDLARFYAKKGRDIAQEAGCEEWTLNIDHLILRIEIHQNNRNEAREAAVLALACARKLGIDLITVPQMDFYERAIKAVDELDVERIGDFDDVTARQQLILELMPKEMKGEVDFLWRRMDVVPAERRLSIMPGCKPIDRKFKMPSMRRTILPSPPKDPERNARIALLKQYAPSHKRPGFVNFDEFE
ncbi:tetratricopeptide repeat protein 25-like protein [Lasius niger]|uniref:Tetratricopeptide repeat protein 25-like protein n=1 Tax=Lasius niger TaxID=67767 RepID=A0A0J7NZX5_LASNI|nr:tetratricopeptide repeat protein 25-like protein [Lasius niger]